MTPAITGPATHRTRRVRAAEALVLAGLTIGFAAVMIAVTGGFSLRVSGLVLRSHNPLPASVLAIICLVAAWWSGSLPDALAGLAAAFERRASAIAAAAALTGIAVGLVWGTYVAGGPDSYCYLNQAEMFARGDVREVQPLSQRAPWPNPLDAFVTVGHVPAAGRSDAIVPMCAAGYPLMMAALRVTAGRQAMFLVVPLLGGLAIWMAFVLGRLVGGPVCGALSAVLLASSPTFLYQVVQPMTDVPSAALWSAAIYLALRAGNRPSIARSVAVGMVTGTAVMVRPNLAPVAAVTALALVCRRPFDWRRALGTGLAFGLGVFPFILSVALLQNAMYGGPLKSGYGTLDRLFSLSHVAPNLALYSRWLIETETPFVVLALAALRVAHDPAVRRSVAWLVAYAAVAVGCYLIYDVFDAWWYLRFVLLAFPAILVLSSLAATSVLSRLRPSFGGAALLALVWILVSLRVAIAYDRHVFRLWDLERRFRDGGEYVGRRLPQNAVVIAHMENGSIRFYSGRPTLTWEPLRPEDLDRVVAYLRAEGYHPFLLFETLEELPFRRKFSAHSRLGSLQWPPAGRINREIQIFDPQDLERYANGERVTTDWVWTVQR